MILLTLRGWYCRRNNFNLWLFKSSDANFTVSRISGIFKIHLCILSGRFRNIRWSILIHLLSYLAPQINNASFSAWEITFNIILFIWNLNFLICSSRCRTNYLHVWLIVLLLSESSVRWVAIWFICIFLVSSVLPGMIFAMEIFLT